MGQFSRVNGLSSVLAIAWQEIKEYVAPVERALSSRLPKGLTTGYVDTIPTALKESRAGEWSALLGSANVLTVSLPSPKKHVEGLAQTRVMEREPNINPKLD